MSWRVEDELTRLQAALEPDEAALRRVRARMAPRPRAVGRPLAWGALALAGIALAIGLLRPSSLYARLDSPSTWQDQTVSRGVDLRFQGQGLAQGAPESPVIHWEEGTVDLAVQPGAGLTVRVQTEEAEVLVIGTRFSVSRDGLGTLVGVEEGRVSVTCSDGTSRFLVHGQRLHCARSAAAALAWVRATPEADPAETLEVLQRALARPDASDPVRDELRFLTLGPLQALGREDEALALAEDALTQPSPRARALHATAARLRVARGDCAGAWPHLTALSEDPTDAVALVLLADCATDDQVARDALERALHLPLAADQRAQVEARLAALPER